MEQSTVKNLLLILTIILLTITAAFTYKNFVYSTMMLNTKDIQIEVTIADTYLKRIKGLSGIKRYTKTQGMLFKFPESGTRQFWMPDTYFNLDIFFLDKELRVLRVERNIPHHVGRNNPDQIPKTKKYYSRHVLEMKSSEYSKLLKISDVLEHTK